MDNVYVEGMEGIGYLHLVLFDFSWHEKGQNELKSKATFRIFLNVDSMNEYNTVLCNVM